MTDSNGTGRDDEVVAPPWWHHHGIKMNVALLLADARLLSIGAPAANVRITRVAAKSDEGWYLDWEVRYSQREEVRGRVVMGSEELKAAFRLPGVMLADDREQYGRWLVDRYGAEFGEQGKFIRTGPYLNVPCPGTGRDGDPNVSIYVDEAITEAVRQILAE